MSESSDEQDLQARVDALESKVRRLDEKKDAMAEQLAYFISQLKQITQDRGFHNKCEDAIKALNKAKGLN